MSRSDNGGDLHGRRSVAKIDSRHAGGEQKAGPRTIYIPVATPEGTRMVRAVEYPPPDRTSIAVRAIVGSVPQTTQKVIAVEYPAPDRTPRIVIARVGSVPQERRLVRAIEGPPAKQTPIVIPVRVREREAK